jgi:hypothetical protein
MVRDELENLLAFGRFYPVFSHENAGFSSQNQLIPKLDADPTLIAQDTQFIVQSYSFLSGELIL